MGGHGNRKRICVRGHDTHETGRHPNGTCKECARAAERRRYRRKSPKAIREAQARARIPDRQRFCTRGHDTWVEGRTPSNRCVVCRRDAARMAGVESRCDRQKASSRGLRIMELGDRIEREPRAWIREELRQQIEQLKAAQ